ncbi:ribosomal protein S18-alanine N-acetyltransferase [Lapidilactobacillus bayanensis]|uniref:ribosomal protein S18-alanine N-acetyltransferase n=1 Tax=Lapidilactobacillus bayanensis TaxID=2485998 RepID=UPI000F78E726|nr:ribosomal protein S18-alanine N-acetyltransferase [Lapidilactobacillus bayanensis]
MLNKFKHLFQPVTKEADSVDQFTEVTFNHQGLTYHLRRLKSANMDQLLAIQRDVYQGQTPWNRLVFLNEVNKRERHLYVGLFTPSDELIGFIGAWYSDLELHITNVAIVRHWQNLGLGKQLMLFMIDQAKQTNCSFVTLEAKVSNDAAKHLYHQLGFVDRKIKKNYYIADHEDAVSMELLLVD